jgi:hypothetical protein
MKCGEMHINIVVPSVNAGKQAHKKEIMHLVLYFLSIVDTAKFYLFCIEFAIVQLK